MGQLQTLSVQDLENLTPAGARDLVVRCFHDAQKETLQRAASTLGAVPGEDALRRTVEGAVRLAFRAVQADFDAPTKPALEGVVSALAAKAAAMGTPQDIIEHHRAQLGRIFAALPD
jgi:hypothetical protein